MSNTFFAIMAMEFNRSRPFQTGDVSEKTDFAFLLNRQIERVGMFGTSTNFEAFINAIDILECMLEPYKDSFFDEEMEKHIKDIDNYLSYYPQNQQAGIQQKLRYKSGIKKFKMLMQLMSRKAFIPTRRVSALDED